MQSPQMAKFQREFVTTAAESADTAEENDTTFEDTIEDTIEDTFEDTFEDIFRRLDPLAEKAGIILNRLDLIQDARTACGQFGKFGRRIVSCEILPLTSNTVVVFHVPIKDADDKALIDGQVSGFGTQFGEKFVVMGQSGDSNKTRPDSGEFKVTAVCESSDDAGAVLARCRAEAARLSVAIESLGNGLVKVSPGSARNFRALLDSFGKQFNNDLISIPDPTTRSIVARLTRREQTDRKAVTEKLRTFARANTVTVREELRETASNGKTTLTLRFSFGPGIPEAKLAPLMRRAVVGTNTTLELENSHASQIRRYLETADKSAMLVSTDAAGECQPNTISIALNFTAPHPLGLLGPEGNIDRAAENDARITAFFNCLVGLQPSQEGTEPQGESTNRRSSGSSSSSVVKRKAKSDQMRRLREAERSLRRLGYRV